jgi:hypothetical protein
LFAQSGDILEDILRTIDFSLFEVHFILEVGVKGGGKSGLHHFCDPRLEFALGNPTSFARYKRKVNYYLSISKFDLMTLLGERVRFCENILLHIAFKHAEESLDWIGIRGEVIRSLIIKEDALKRDIRS